MLAAFIRRLAGVPWSLVAPTGTVLSILSLGYRYTYCLDGPGMGAPLAVLRPSHFGSTLTTTFIGELSNVPTEIYLPAILINAVFWAALVALVLPFLPRRLLGTTRKLHQSETGR